MTDGASATNLNSRSEEAATLRQCGVCWGRARSTDCRGAHAELAARGVPFVQEPTDMGYGIDCELADPWGDRVRIVERAAVPAA